jgi:hypothetical protein
MDEFYIFPLNLRYVVQLELLLAVCNKTKPKTILGVTLPNPTLLIF